MLKFQTVPPIGLKYAIYFEKYNKTQILTLINKTPN